MAHRGLHQQYLAHVYVMPSEIRLVNMMQRKKLESRCCIAGLLSMLSRSSLFSSIRSCVGFPAAVVPAKHPTVRSLEWKSTSC